MKARFLTPAVRRKLKRPLGTLLKPSRLRGEGHLLEMADARMVITVGDRVTETLHELGRTPEVQVVDETERRVARAPPDVPFARLIRASNPPGMITDQAKRAIASAFRSMARPVRVLVEGEEDLLAIPAVISAPLRSIVYYGQPKVGVVMVPVDGNAKARAGKLLREMPSRKTSAKSRGTRSVPRRHGWI